MAHAGRIDACSRQLDACCAQRKHRPWRRVFAAVGPSAAKGCVGAVALAGLGTGALTSGKHIGEWVWRHVGGRYTGKGVNKQLLTSKHGLLCQLFYTSVSMILCKSSRCDVA